MLLPPNQDLLNSLTSHISLYHSQTLNTNNNNNNNNKNTILKWFTTLTPHQRQSHLTTFSPNFVQILLQMSDHIHSRGPGYFILLPDLPQHQNPSLPTLCYRKSDGLLSRVSTANIHFNLVKQNVRMFGSESEGGLDVMSVGEEFVSNVERFVGVMDGITNGAFLRQDFVIGEEWGEMGWLKERGYYSLEEFVVNRIEVSLRLAWLGCGRRKGGGRVKDKVSGTGVGANLFWRKKGCVDWWEKLDGGMRERIFVAYLGKSAKMLVYIYFGIYCL